MAKLGDVATYINGYAFKPSDWSDIGLPIIRIQDLTGNAYKANRYNGKYDLKYEINEGDVLISWSASLGVYIWHGEKAILNQHIFKVVFDKTDISKNFFVYQVENILEKAASEAHGATMKHLTKPVFDSLPFYLPTIEEQHKIADTLDKISDLIAKRRRQLEKLDMLVKSRFIEMFGIPGADHFGWGIVTLNSVCQINPKKSNDNRLESGVEVSFVPMPAVTETGKIDASTVKTYDDVKTGFTYFSENDVLFAKITPCMENGKGAIAKGLCNGIGFGSTEFHVLRPINGRANSYWVFVLTTLSQFRADAANNMTGSAGQRRVPASFLENYRVSVPPLDLQNQFAAFVEQIDKSKSAVQNSLEKLEILKKSLMQKYFG